MTNPIRYPRGTRVVFIQSMMYSGMSGVLVSDAASVSSVVNVKLDKGGNVMTRMYCLEPEEGK